MLLSLANIIELSSEAFPPSIVNSGLLFNSNSNYDPCLVLGSFRSVIGVVSSKVRLIEPVLSIYKLIIELSISSISCNLLFALFIVGFFEYPDSSYLLLSGF